MNVHIYSSVFENENKAFKFANEMDFDDDDSIPELWRSIGADWLDSDFIETVYGNDKLDYVKSLLNNKNDANEIVSKCTEEHNVFFLIFVVDGTSNEDFKPTENDNPLYIGSFDVTLG